MTLYIINHTLKINNSTAIFLLEHLREYQGNIITYFEIVNDLQLQQVISQIKADLTKYCRLNIIRYIDKLTIGRLQHQIRNMSPDIYIKYQWYHSIYYLIQTNQCNLYVVTRYIRYYDSAECLNMLLEMGFNLNKSITIRYGRHNPTITYIEFFEDATQCVELINNYV